jgi:two-component system, chemotaxis family, protein-glutamate methylesterase/glutaminase
MSRRNIIVIGASAGGLPALQRLMATLPHDLPAAMFITLHRHGGRDGLLPRLLDKAAHLPAAHAKDGELVTKGRIYIAPPDYHLMLEDGRVFLSHGPKENLQRPCINAMFRSAAAAYGPHVVGVLLTGLLDDGAAGLWEIQQHGGATIVQDPDEAQFRSMPENAIRGLNVQYILRLEEIGPLLQWLSTQDGADEPLSYAESEVEVAAQSCPMCGGAMTVNSQGKLQEYRCHVGHRFGLKSLMVQKRGVLEGILDAALAQSEELTALLQGSLAESSDPEGLRELREEIMKRMSEQETLRALTGAQKRAQVES